MTIALKPYHRPVIEVLPFLALEKHQLHNITVAADEPLTLDTVDLLQKFGSPLYVVSEQRLRQDFKNFKRSFTDEHVNTKVAYSIKTNYLPAVCAILRQEGAQAEVVSGMEYELARTLGIPGKDIIFNGPHKTQAELKLALSEGALVNIDNFNELELIDRISEELITPARVAIRVNFRFGTNPWTKFGFNNENGESLTALKKISRNKKLQFVGFHCHVGTFVLVHELYANAVEKLIELAKQAREIGLNPTSIDIGGGFPSANTLRPEYDLPGGSQRTNNDYLLPYAEHIFAQLRKHSELFGNNPTLILEPGRAIVDASTQLLSTVIAKKEIVGGRNAVIIDAGVNLVPTVCYYNHQIKTVAATKSEERGLLKPVDIFGPLCMQSDRLREQILMPALNVGDHLSIGNVGAYCHTQSNQFIQPRPATILLGDQGPELIRRAETYRDIFALDLIPGRLRDDKCQF
ncbi:MAG TPA: diaminopimelate decarboxylase [Colwellia sp.]|jgi:diaminopimelate decarboxylase|nr:diaminopimelate decarboxylase [Colwellia sp.]